MHDELANSSFPADIADPARIKDIEPNPLNFPYPYALGDNAEPTALFYHAIDTAAAIINGSAGIEGNCTRCLAAITAGQVLARAAPNNFSDGVIRLCKLVKLKADADCERDYARDVPELAVWAQVLQAANVLENDGRFICNSMFGQSWCDKPEAVEMKVNFGVEKPANATAPPPSGKRVKVLHLSDIHLDPRYTVGAEAVDCASEGCCRPDPSNATLIKNPAPLNGHPNCDTPLSLLTSALSSVAPLTGKNSTTPGTIEWTLFTGDVLPRENAKFRNDEYLAFVQSTIFKVMKYFLPRTPVFPVLGPLDAFNEEPSTRHPLTGGMRDSQTQNYDRMKAILDVNQWLTKDESAAIGPHHMGYTTLHPRWPKLRIIALNTNFWWLQNYYTYVNTTTPQDSIILSDLIGWLLLAEKDQERVWIVGHIPPFAAQSLPDHSGVFYQVVERFTPHVIAGIFFGHLHTDSVNVFYKAGGKDVTKEDNAVIASWIAPSLSPKNGNPSYKVYDVDTGDFGIYQSRTYYTNTSTLSTVPTRDANATTDSSGKNGSANGLEWELGCDARKAYGKASNWPTKSPLNGAFWHRVGNAMLQDKTSAEFNLAATYHMYRSTSIDGKGVRGRCDEACVNATVCRMRAAKEALWERCGSDQVQKSGAASNGTTSKRSADPEEDLDIDIYIDYDNSGTDTGDSRPPSNYDLQARAEKRWKSGFWSKVSSMANAAGFTVPASNSAPAQTGQTQGQSSKSSAAGFTVPASNGAGNQKAQDAQGRSQSPSSSASGHATLTTTVTGTSTSTVTVSAKNGASSSIGKRGEESEADGVDPADVQLEARSADPQFGDYQFTSDLLPASTEAITGLWGVGGLSGAMTANQGITSTGYQLLNQIMSAQSARTTLSMITQHAGGTTPSVRAKLGRDVTMAPQDGGSDAADSEHDVVDGRLGQPEGSSQENQIFADGAQVADEPLSKRDAVPADAPDTTTTAASNVPTDAFSGEATEEPRDFPIYRPDESMNGQIVRRRPASDGDGGASATPTPAHSPSGGPAASDSAPTPFPGSDEDYDPEALAAGVDMVIKRNEDRKPGCVTYSLSSVCSSSVPYVEYTPEQTMQILQAYQGGAAGYNALMKTISKKSTSRWSTYTVNHAASKRDEQRKPGCNTYSSSSVCSASVPYVAYTPEQTMQILQAYQGGAASYNALMKTMSKKSTSRWSTYTVNFAAPPTKRDLDIPGCTSNSNGLVCTRVTDE